MAKNNPWQNWRWIDAVTWNGQVTEEAAFLCWYEAHKHLVSDVRECDRLKVAKCLYTNCQDIKDFNNQTFTGRLLYAIYRLNKRLVCTIRHPGRLASLWAWQVKYWLKTRDTYYLARKW